MKRPTAFIVAITALAAAITALAVAYASAAPVQAQDESYRQPIDLAVEIEEAGPLRSYYLDVIVTNNSEVAVHDVVVNIEDDPPALDTFDTSVVTSAGTFANGKWTIPHIGPGEQIELSPDRTERSGVPDTRFFSRVRASLASSSPKETPGLEYNNRAEVWVFVYTGRPSVPPGLGSIAGRGVGLQVEVDDLRPAPDGQAVFKVSAKNTAFVSSGTRSAWRKTGVQVKVTLSPGLSFASSNLSNTTISGNTAIWRAGDLLAARNDVRRTKTLSIPVNLSGSVPLERRCLTAEVVRVVPPDTEDWRYDEVSTVCLGDGPLEVFGAWSSTSDDERHIDLFSFFPCIGVTTYPCSTEDTLELVVEVDLGNPHVRMKQRRDDTARPPTSTGLGSMFLQPESVVIHVDDRLGRSLEDGSVIWSTEDLMNLRDSQERLSASWTDLREDVTVTAPGGGDAAGRWVMEFASTGNDLLDAPDSSKVTGTPWTPSSFYSSPSDYVEEINIKFWALGTYKVLFEIRGTLSGTTYTDSGTFTFHVGPVAELEVRDAGASPDVARGKRAYTIEAVNNGPDAVSAAVVTVAGAPEGARVVPSQGDYYEAFCGGNGLCEGVWTVGELAAPETAPLFGQSNSATLAIIAEGDPITATIESTRDYTVCIDDNGVDVAASTESACEGGGNIWHSAEYYDHSTSGCFDSAAEKVEASGRSDCEATSGNGWYSNDRDVRITSRPGTGQGHPEAPPSLRVDKFGILTLLRWGPVERVNGFDVTHYQVERNGVMLAEAVGGTIYADLQGAAVNQSYRVRAVNELGVPGPWSLPAGAGGTLEQPEELGAPTGLTATPGSGVGRIDLSWFASSEEQGLRYRIEHATDGAGPWRTLVGSQSGTTYSHTGLISGTTHYYRVAALKGSLTSPWAYVQATTEGPQTYAPGWPMNLRFTTVDRTAVTLAWDPPADDGGSPVTGYEYRVFGPCASGADAVCDVVAPTRVGGTTTSRRITGLNREGTYEFSVRALNAVGAGDWSQPITKEVGPETAGGGRVVLSPTRLTVTEGGEATYRVKLSRAPTMPLWVTMHWDGSGVDNLGGELPFQQFKILLPSGYDTSGLPEWCGGVRLDWNEAYAWNVGVPITVTAAEDEDSDHESLTILHSLDTVTHDCLGMSEEDWQPDPVYDGMHGIALQVTERDND